MNKFIPLTLASVIVIAMIFAVTPIEYAQTTHAATTIVGADSVTSASIADDTVAAADLIGASTQDSPFRIISNTNALAVVATAAYTPPVASTAIVHATIEINPDGTNALTDLTWTISEDGNGIVTGMDAEMVLDDMAGGNHEEAFGATWIVTGASTATIITITAAGTNLADAEIDSHSVTVLWIPE